MTRGDQQGLGWPARTALGQDGLGWPVRHQSAAPATDEPSREPVQAAELQSLPDASDADLEAQAVSADAPETPPEAADPDPEPVQAADLQSLPDASDADLEAQAVSADAPATPLEAADPDHPAPRIMVPTGARRARFDTPEQGVDMMDTGGPDPSGAR